MVSVCHGRRDVQRFPKKTPAQISGFFTKGDVLVGAMKSVKGRGVYFLQSDSTQEYYYGWQTALDCEVAVNVVCPYVLGPEALIGKLQQDLTFISKGRCRREAAN
jgi:hypothetical protein